MAGMVGSRQGWVEAPYCPCPAGLDDIAARLLRLTPAAGTTRRIAIVPGISCEHGGVPDVMRGEEIKILGALELLGIADATLVLPGTHSKWATVEGGRIRGFSTVMSGEFYALLRQHSILARTLAAPTMARSMARPSTAASPMRSRPAACCRPRSACARSRCSTACRAPRCRATCRVW